MPDTTPPTAATPPRRSGIVGLTLGLLLVPAAAGAFPHAPSVAGAGSNHPSLPVALTPPTDPMPRWGAIYAAPSAAGFGLTVGRADRQEARRAAETQCRGAGAATAAMRCHLVAEFAERCAAVAQSVERRAAAPRVPRATSAGFIVTSVAAGAGRTVEEAESAALSICERDQQRGFCLVAASACGPQR